MSHCYHNCRYSRLESTAVTNVGGTLQITVTPIQAYKNYQRYCLFDCPSLPQFVGTEPVAVFDGSISYPLTDDNGNPVVAGRMRGHKRYCLHFGAGGTLSSGTVPPHFTVCKGLECMEYSSNAALQQNDQEV